jgi:hypothetical protein
MKYANFRSHLGRASLTNKEFAELVGLNSNSITNYAQNDHVPIHWAIVVLLMDEMAGNGIDFKHLLQKLDIKPNKVRGAAAKGRWGGSKQMDIYEK